MFQFYLGPNGYLWILGIYYLDGFLTDSSWNLLVGMIANRSISSVCEEPLEALYSVLSDTLGAECLGSSLREGRAGALISVGLPLRMGCATTKRPVRFDHRTRLSSVVFVNVGR